MSHNAQSGPSRTHTHPTAPSPAATGRAQLKDRPQLGHLARWAVSSHKYGYGVDNLRDGNDATYWQSEGPQPHLIDLSFPRRVLISAVSILTSHPGDDSYTPSKISVQCGTTVHDLQEIRLCEFNQPEGWQHIAARPMDSSDQEIEGPPISAFHLRIVVLANHLNGKDTHIRGLRVFGAPAGSTHLLSAGQGMSRGQGGVDEEGDESHSESDSDSDGKDLAAAAGYAVPVPGHPARGAPTTGTSSSTSMNARGADDGREARARQEVLKRERRMRKLLRDGGADKVGYTSRAFKMHQVIR